MQITFHDINKSVNIDGEPDESTINEIHDSLLKDVTSGDIPSIEKPKNIFQQVLGAIRSSNQQAEAGGREFLRHPFGGTGSYMKGFSDPSVSEPFAQQFPRQDMESNPDLMEDKNTISAFLATLPHNIAGSTLDTALNPLQAAMGTGIGKYGGAIAKGIGKFGGAIGKRIAESPFGKAIGGVGKGIGNVLTKSARLKYMDKMENAVYQAREVAAPNFGKGIEQISANNPGKLVDMSEVSSRLLKNEDPIIQSIIDKSPELQDLATHPTGQVPLQQAQDALNSLTTRVSKSVLGGAGKRSMHLPVVDLVDNMKLAMSKDLPEIQGLRDTYAQVINDFRSIRPKLTGDAAAKNLFADYNPLNPRGKEFMGGERSEEKFRRLVGENVFREAVGTRKAKVIKDIGTIGLLGAGEETARRSLLKK